LSYFSSSSPAERKNKRLPKLKELTSVPAEERKLTFVTEEADIANVNKEIDFLPNVDITITAAVDGETDICDNDLVDVKVTINRK